MREVSFYSVLATSIAQLLLIGGFILHQNTIWVRVKDRLNMLYKEYCEKHGIPYISLDNSEGHK